MRRPAQPMVAGGGEQRDGAAGRRPERRPEDGAGVGPRLLQVAVIELAAVGITVVADGNGEPGAAGRDPAVQSGLVGAGAGAVDLAPVTEHGKAERGAAPGRHLGLELGRAVGGEQIGAGQLRPVTVGALAGQADRAFHWYSLTVPTVIVVRVAVVLLASEQVPPLTGPHCSEPVVADGWSPS